MQLSAPDAGRCKSCLRIATRAVTCGGVVKDNGIRCAGALHPFELRSKEPSLVQRGFSTWRYDCSLCEASEATSSPTTNITARSNQQRLRLMDDGRDVQELILHQSSELAPLWAAMGWTNRTNGMQPRLPPRSLPQPGLLPPALPKKDHGQR